MIITVGTTDLYTSTLLENDAVAIPNDTVILDETWAGIAQLFKRDTLAIHHAVEESSTAEITAKDAAGTWAFDKGMQVLVREIDGTMIFGGFVDSCEKQPLGGLSSLVWHAISCVDWHYLATKRLVVYAAEDTATDVAVRYILDTYLAEEGISEGYIEPGVVLTEIALNYVTCSAALAKLAEASNFTWYIDENRKLYFCSRTTYAAEWTLTNDDIERDSLRITDGNPKYRNRQYVLGAYAETVLQTEQFLGDGTQSSFTVGYPINRVYSITVNGAAQSVGFKGTDTGYNWYYAVESDTFTQDSAGTKVPTGQIIEIKYYGLYKKLSMQEDDTQILAEKAMEGVGTGIVEAIETDESLTSGEAADEYANVMLSAYAVAGKVIKYVTRRTGLAAGVQQTCLGEGVFLITNYDLSYNNDICYYTITGVQGPVVESWEKFFLLAFSNVQKIRENLGEGEAVRALTVFSKYWTEAERPNIWTEAYPSHDAYILENDAELLPNDAVVMTWAWAYESGYLMTVDDDRWPCFDPDDRVKYLVLISSAGEGFRKQITLINDATEGVIGTTTYISGPEANDVQWTHIAMYGGDSCSAVAGSGVEIDRQAFLKEKSFLESLQIDHRNYIWS